MTAQPTVTIHEKYQPLLTEQNSRYYLVLGGRASGKSFSVSTILVIRLCEPGQRILYTRYTMTSAETSIIPEFREKIEMLGLSSVFEIRQREIINTQTDSSILFSGIKESSGNQTAKLKSLTGITSWVLEEAEELDDEEIFDKIDMSVRALTAKNRIILILNPSWKTHWIYRRFYEPYMIPEEYNGVVGPVCHIHTTYEDNIRNLPPDILQIIEERKRTNYQKYLHIDRGHWATEITGALWTYDMIAAARVWQIPDLRRIVVAVDPAVTASETSDETGIIVGGIDYNDHIYILADRSLIGTPLEWARAVVAAYTDYGADRVVAEVNQGGDLVEANIRMVDKTLAYKAVRASRGKRIRAEPVAALYEQGRVHHIGRFAELEDQLCTWSPLSDDSPDRLDALVWLCTELTDKTPAYQKPIVFTR